jgi:TctA family transporter
MIGILPGIGPLVTISVLLPLTFKLEPTSAVIMLAGIWYGAQYGGSTTAILVNLPGESSSAVTCIDGNKMARQGRAGPALAVAAIGSFFAGCVGTVEIALLAKPLSSLAFDFRAPEYFSLIVFSLCCASALVSGSFFKGLGMALLGILFGLIGTDINTGHYRFTLGLPALIDGIDLAVVAMGIFAFGDIIVNLSRPAEDRSFLSAKITGLMPTRADFKVFWKSIVRGTAVGSFLGVLPGVGTTISAFTAYAFEKSVSTTPSRFGEGAIEGVAAPEAANNAAAQTSFIPTLTLGIPGSGTMALFLGALMIQGITPGPGVITSHPDLFWGLVASMWIGNLMLVLLNLPLVGVWTSMLKIPYDWLFPSIMVFACVGLYTVNLDGADIAISAFFGFLGYLFIRLECNAAAFLLGFVLGPMLEENFRRALLISHGDATVFIREPLSAGFLIAGALLLALMAVLPKLRQAKEIALEAED